MPAKTIGSTTLTTSTKLGSVWKMAKKMTGTSAREMMPNLVVEEENKETVIYDTNQAKANLLAQTYAKTSSDENFEPNFYRHKHEMETKWRTEPPPPVDESAEID